MMGPVVDSVRFKGEMIAFVRARNQLESAILANEQEDTQYFERETQQAGPSPNVQQPTPNHDPSKAPKQKQTTPLHNAEPSLANQTTPAGTMVSRPSNLYISPATPVPLSSSESGKLIGPPSYRAIILGDWGPYSSSIPSLIQKTHPFEESESQGGGGGSEEKASGSNMLSGGGGGNVLSNWLKKQKVTELLAKVTGKEEQPSNLKYVWKMVQLAQDSSSHASLVPLSFLPCTPPVLSVLPTL